MFLVFRVENVENSRFFVGTTQDWKRTKREMKSRIKNGDGSKIAIGMIEDWTKSDKKVEDLFVWEIICEVRDKEEAKIWCWFLAVEEIEGQKAEGVMDRDSPNVWKLHEKLYNTKGWDLKGLSREGKELVCELTGGLEVTDSGRFVMGMETDRTRFYASKSRAVRLMDKVIYGRTRVKKV